MIPYITIIVLNSMILGKIWKSTQFRKRFVVSEIEEGKELKREAARIAAECGARFRQSKLAAKLMRVEGEGEAGCAISSE